MGGSLATLRSVDSPIRRSAAVELIRTAR
jgi:hypothetical protein